MRLTFSRNTPTSTNEEEGYPVGATPVTWNAEAVILPPKSHAGETKIAAGMRGRYRHLILAGKGATGSPEVGDVTTFEGSSWKILPGFTPINPDGVAVIIWKVDVEQA